MLTLAAVLGSAIGQDAQQRNVLLFKEGYDTMVQHVSRDQCIFAIVKLGKSNFRVSVNKGLLIDSADALDRADIVRVLRSQITRMSRLDLAMSLFLLLRLLPGQKLAIPSARGLALAIVSLRVPSASWRRSAGHVATKRSAPRLAMRPTHVG